MTSPRLVGAFAMLSVAVSSVAGIAPGPNYVYQLTSSTNSDVCSHMNAVFNQRFATLWASPTLLESDPSLAADGPYAFPRLPGVDHDYEATFAMRASRMPSSPEFDAIPWKEARAIFGEPPESAGPQNDKAMPVLIAFFDLYNDGHVDTVIKNGFTQGYSYMANSGGNGVDDEWLTVVSDARISLEPVLSLWKLRNDAHSQARWITSIDAAYERPFVYQGVTYVAQYEIDLGKYFAAANRPPYKPRAERMIVVKLHPPDHLENPRALVARETVCKYKMTQVSRASGE